MRIKSVFKLGLGALIAAGAFLAPLIALASQNPLTSPNTGTVTGLQLTNNYNNAVDSVNTANSGNAAPTNQLSGSPSKGNFWLNTSTSPNQLEMYDGTSWTIVGYLDTTNHIMATAANGGAGGSIASASSTNLCSVATPYVTVTGTTGITSFGSSCSLGTIKYVTFSGILTLTYNGTSLILPSGATNITTAAGDQAQFIYLGSGNWTALSYSKASGQITGSSATKVLLATYTPSGVASQNDTTSLTGTYSEYEIDLENLLPATNGVALTVKFQSGGSFQSTNYAYQAIVGFGSSPTYSSSTAGTYLPIVYGSNISNASGTGVTCRITVSNVSSSSIYKHFQSHCSTLGTGSQEIDFIDGMWAGGTGTITGVSFAFTSGNINGGTIKIYGWN